MAILLQDNISISDYVERAGLHSALVGTSLATFSEKVLHNQALLATFIAQSSALACWQYHVPLLGEGGACSLFGQLDDEPYQLAPILGGKTSQNDNALTTLAKIAAFYKAQSNLDWFGIYQARTNNKNEPVLVKLAYYGAPSRAEFPLTADFAKISNNSTVGLSGKAKIINDVGAYLNQGGEYYTCDPKVQSEACLPLFDTSGKIVGIVDAEDFNKNVFTVDALALLVTVCLSAAASLP